MTTFLLLCNALEVLEPLCWLLLLKMLLSCPKRSITHFLGSWYPCGHAHSFVTSHPSTAFTFSMRWIILFSALQRHRAWDIRSLKPERHGKKIENLYWRLGRSVRTESVTGNALRSYSLRSTHQTGGEKVSSMTVYSLVFERISQVASTGVWAFSSSARRMWSF